MSVTKQYFVDVVRNAEAVRHEVAVDQAALPARAVIPGVDGPAVFVDDAAHVAATGNPVRLLRIGNRVIRVGVSRGDARGQYTLSINDAVYIVDAADARTRAIRDMTAQTAAAAGPAPLKAPMPGLIVRVNVNVGDEVASGQGLVVMEAMKMENELRATSAGTVKAIHAKPGAAVEKGAILVELE